MHTTTSLAVLLTALAVTAQDQRPTALVNARILTMTDGGSIERGTVLIRDGKIEAVGPDVRPPLGARVIDVAGGTVMPGYVHAWSGAGLSAAPRAPQEAPDPTRGRRGRGPRPEAPPQAPSGSNSSSKRVADGVYERQDVFADLLREGVTSLSVRPLAPGFPGLAARLEPDGITHGDLVTDPESYVVVAPATNTAGKKLLKDEFDKAKKALEERKKPPEAPKPAGTEGQPAATPETKPADAQKPAEGGKPAEEPKPQEPPKPQDQPKPASDAKPAAAPAQAQPAPKKDPNVEVLADVLDGKRKTFVRMSTVMEMQHWLDAVGEMRFPMVVVADAPDARRGRPDEGVAELKKLGASLLLTPRLLDVPFSRTLVNVPKRLHDAGIALGFVLPDDPAGIRDLRFRLMELVRSGLPADAALRAVTAVPAKLLGIDDKTGSIAAGLRADLLVFDGDPLDPSATLRHVFLRGREITEAPTR